MKLDIDLTQVKDLSPIPDGVYIIELANCKDKMSKANKPKLSWEARIIAPMEVAREVPIWFFDTSLADNALFTLKQLVEAAGKLKAGGFETADLIGVQVGVQVVIEETVEYGIRNRIVKFIPIKKTIPEIVPEALAKFQAEKAALAEAAQGSGASASGQSA